MTIQFEYSVKPPKNKTARIPGAIDRFVRDRIARLDIWTILDFPELTPTQAKSCMTRLVELGVVEIVTPGSRGRSPRKSPAQVRTVYRKAP
jgi:hypothetical protein